MAWTTMHFAMGMGCAGATAGLGCMLFRGGWRWIPAAMTLGGLWALVPDMPRIFREDIYYEPISSILGTQELERALHSWGDIFFFHQQLDAQPKEFALLGLILILLLYNASILLLMGLEYKHRNSLGNREWRTHRSPYARLARRKMNKRLDEIADDRYEIDDDDDELNAPPKLLTFNEDNPDVIYRIRPGHMTGTDEHPL